MRGSFLGALAAGLILLATPAEAGAGRDVLGTP